jgi:hypothetical protein
LPSGRARYPLAIDPERSIATNLLESIMFSRLEKIANSNARKRVDDRVLPKPLGLLICGAVVSGRS